METLIIIVSILLIAIVLLQSGKAEGSSQIISGSNADLFKNKKERGSEKFLSNLTFALGLLFFMISLLSNIL